MDGAGDALLTTAFGTAALERRPAVAHHELRAWDGADVLLLEAPALSFGQGAPGQDLRGDLLIVGEAFGALAVSLRRFAPVSWSDSAVTRLATLDNLRRNSVPADAGAPAVRLERDETLLGGPFRTIVWRVPRSVRQLRFEAAVIHRVASSDAVVLAAGMDKHLPPSTPAVMAELGALVRHPGARKAHVYEVRVDLNRPAPVPMPIPVVPVAELGITLEGGHQVFSAERLDPGARVMAAQLHRLPASSRIADLCCGNGVLGIMAARSQPEAQLHFFDESWSAVDAARRNVERNLPGRTAAYHWDDGMGAYDGERFDAVVCNPPFHQHATVTHAVADRMLADAHRHLRPGGELWVVGNRHLGYHMTLRRLFGNCRQVAAHPKFVVLAAVR